MEKVEKTENFKEEQILEGFIGEYTDWQKKLPEGIEPEMVDLFLASGGWHWHIKPEYIKDEQEREGYNNEKKQWE
mgnify:FL=1